MTKKKLPTPKMCAGSHCKGKNEADDPHSCPFAKEIGDNPDPDYCTCCPDCTHECAMDI